MKKGILGFVYKHGQDCTNNGLSNKKDKLILIGENGENFDSPFGVDENDDYLVLVEAFKDNPQAKHLRAVPKSVLDSGRWYMFGGNFLYSSDSRFLQRHL